MAPLLFVDFYKAFDSIYRKRMEQILLAYGFTNEAVTAIMSLYKRQKQCFAHQMESQISSALLSKFCKEIC